MNLGIFFSLSARVLALAVMLGCVVKAQTTELQPDRSIEILGFGSELGELKLLQGKELQIITVKCIPPGPIVNLPSASPVEFQRRAKTADGKETWISVAKTEIPVKGGDLAAVLVPNPQPLKEGSLFYSVRLFPRPATLPGGTIELSNFTPTPLMVQLGDTGAPLELEPWGQRLFTPKVDDQFCVMVRIAYRSAQDNEWKLVKGDIVGLPPTQAMRYSFVFAPSGMGDLIKADFLTGERNKAATESTLFLMEGNVPVTPTKQAAAH